MRIRLDGVLLIVATTVIIVAIMMYAFFIRESISLMKMYDSGDWTFKYEDGRVVESSEELFNALNGESGYYYNANVDNENNTVILIKGNSGNSDSLSFKSIMYKSK